MKLFPLISLLFLATPAFALVTQQSAGVTVNNALTISSAPLQSDVTGSGTLSALNGAVTVNTNGAQTATFVCTGTWSGSINTEVTPDGSTFVGINYYAPGQGFFGVISPGVMGVMNVSGWRQFRVRMTSFTSGSAFCTIEVGAGSYLQQVYDASYTDLLGQFKLTDGTHTAAVTATGALQIDGSAVTQPVSVTGTAIMQQSPTSLNPCQNPNVTIHSASATTSGTSASQIIAASGTTQIFVCALSVIGTSGTSPTFSLVYGTGTNCATGQTTLVAPFSTTAGVMYPFSGPPVAVTPASQAVCFKDGGTSPIQSYTISYVQQ